MKDLTVESIIKALNLEPLFMEGGFFKVFYISETKDSKTQRPVGSSIYYLLTPENFSRLHKHDADEIFHHYAGDTVTQVFIDSNNTVVKNKIGKNFLDGEKPQHLVPANCWQSMFYDSDDTVKHGWSLLGATVHPSFNEKTFQTLTSINDIIVNDENKALIKKLI